MTEQGKDRPDRERHGIDDPPDHTGPGGLERLERWLRDRGTALWGGGNEKGGEGLSDRDEDFEYEHEGKILRCTRRISGKVVLKQTIGVPGFGTREDRHSYGGRHTDPRMMEPNAKQTAFEIIRDSKRRP